MRPPLVASATCTSQALEVRSTCIVEVHQAWRAVAVNFRVPKNRGFCAHKSVDLKEGPACGMWHCLTDFTI